MDFAFGRRVDEEGDLRCSEVDDGFEGTIRDDSRGDLSDDLSGLRGDGLVALLEGAPGFGLVGVEGRDLSCGEVTGGDGEAGMAGSAGDGGTVTARKVSTKRDLTIFSSAVCELSGSIAENVAVLFEVEGPAAWTDEDDAINIELRDDAMEVVRCR